MFTAASQGASATVSHEEFSYDALNSDPGLPRPGAPLRSVHQPAMAAPLNPESPFATPPQPPATKTKVITKVGRVIFAPFIAVGRLVCGKSKIDEIVVFSASPAF